MYEHLAIFVLAFVAIAHAELNVCSGRPPGYVRDLNSCNHFYWCEYTNSIPVRGACENGELFDGERELCVPREKANCFRCPKDELIRLVSVPRACAQYISCFAGRPTWSECPSGLVFDGRKHVRSCNVHPPFGQCFRENDNPAHEPVWERCPTITDRPIYVADKRSCSVYYSCPASDAIPERQECDLNLHFNHDLGVCDSPQNARCPHSPPEVTTPSPTVPTTPGPPEPTTPAPPTGVPAKPCPLEGGIFVPDRFDCTIYHACLRGGGHRTLRCPAGKYFDTVTTLCQLPEKAVCYSE